MHIASKSMSSGESTSKPTGTTGAAAAAAAAAAAGIDILNATIDS
jgi:hypothetical protein